MPHIGSPIPTKWTMVRQTLEQSKQDYLTLDEYFHICDNYGLDSHQDKLVLSQYLHDMGIFLHFQNDLLLKNIIILNPIWVTDAI